ncbi:hypothetical protein Bpla01_63740 [Burkholderia plantarii]|nr:hypothetical protein Bpla01_63740 [Burkholderia plantarii]
MEINTSTAVSVSNDAPGNDFDLGGFLERIACHDRPVYRQPQSVGSARGMGGRKPPCFDLPVFDILTHTNRLPPNAHVRQLGYATQLANVLCS